MSRPLRREERTGRSDTDAPRDGAPATGREEASRKERGHQTWMPRETAHQPRAGRRPPAASGSGLRTAPQHPDPEVSTSSHTQDQVTRQRGWARDPSSSLSHQLCDARRQGMRHHITDKTEARQGQGDPRAHLCGLGCGAGRGEACAHLGALIPRRSHSGNGECPLQENAAVQARARREGSAVPGWAPDHREDGRMDTGRLSVPAAYSTWRSGWGGTTSQLPGLRGCGQRPSAWEPTGRWRAHLGAQL